MSLFPPLSEIEARQYIDGFLSSAPERIIDVVGLMLAESRSYVEEVVDLKRLPSSSLIAVGNVLSEELMAALPLPPDVAQRIAQFIVERKVRALWLPPTRIAFYCYTLEAKGEKIDGFMWLVCLWWAVDMEVNTRFGRGVGFKLIRALYPEWDPRKWTLLPLAIGRPLSYEQLNRELKRKVGSIADGDLTGKLHGTGGDLPSRAWEVLKKREELVKMLGGREEIEKMLIKLGCDPVPEDMVEISKEVAELLLLMKVLDMQLEYVPKALKRDVIDLYRRETAQKRYPPGGMDSLEEERKNASGETYTLLDLIGEEPEVERDPRILFDEIRPEIEDHYGKGAVIFAAIFDRPGATDKQIAQIVKGSLPKCSRETVNRWRRKFENDGQFIKPLLRRLRP